MEEDSVIEPVELSNDEFALTNDHEVYETLENENDNIISIYPNLIPISDERNDISTESSKEEYEIEKHKNIVLSKQDEYTTDSDELLQAKISTKPIQIINVSLDESTDDHISSGDDDTPPHEDNLEVILTESDHGQSENLKNFLENMIITQYKCKLCTLSFDFLQDAHLHLIDQHLKSHASLLNTNNTSHKKTVPKKRPIPKDINPETSDSSEPILKTKKAKIKTTKRPVKRTRFAPKNQDRSYPCDWPDCNYIARHTVHLRDHKRVHSGEKPYSCSWPDCAHSFIQASALKTHMRTHTGEKPFKCDWPGCSMLFSQKSNLRSHQRTHTGEKPYRCEWPGCESRFTIKGNLEEHKKIHNDDKQFVCDYPGCTGRFTQNSYLRRHKLTHQGEKPFACDWLGCTYRTTRQGDLNTHRKIHTGEKKHRCNICQKCFSRSGHLKRHITNLHSNNNSHENSVTFTQHSSMYVNNGCKAHLN